MTTFTNERLRPEAQLFAWEQLTAEQRRCAVGVIQWLGQYVSCKLPEDSTERGLLYYVRIDEERASNVVLIDGDRGAGKTSVLIKLLDMLVRGLRGEILDRAPPSDNAEGRDEYRAISAEFERSGRLRGRLVPTRILDLQPLPAGTPLLTWIATRLHDVVEAVDEQAASVTSHDRRPEPGRWEPGWKQEPASRLAWRELMQVIAGGWDGNLSHRRGNLDPEAYAIELEQSERSRLTLGDRWRAFIDALIKDANAVYPHDVGKEARLVVSIDDADMNPQRSVELLDLLRTLWHPRIVFLLTGDARLFQATLRNHFYGSIYQAGHGTKLPVRMEEDGEQRAKVLARVALDKAIPLAQRMRIHELVPQERLRTFGKSLVGMSVRTTPAPTPFPTYLDLAPELAAMLPGHLRPLRSLTQALESAPRTVAGVSKVLWESARDDDLLDHKADEARAERAFFPYGDAIVVALTEFRLWAADLATTPTKDGRAFAVHGVRLFLTGLKDEVSPTPRLAATLLFLASIAEDDPDSVVVGAASSELDGLRWSFAGGTLRTDEGTRRFRWPMPSWAAPVDWYAFSFAWAGRLKPNPVFADADSLALAFLQTVVAFGRARAWAKEQELGRVAQADWSSVVADVIELVRAPSTEPRAAVLRRWAIQTVVLLAAPESGLSPEYANSFLRRWLEAMQAERQAGSVSNSELEEIFDRLLTARTERLKANFPNQSIDAEATLRRIDRIHGAFEWGSAILSREGRRQARVMERLRAVSVRDGETLAAYVDDLQLLSEFAPDQSAQAERLERGLDALERHPGDVQRGMVAFWHEVARHGRDVGGETARLQGLVSLDGDRLRVAGSRRSISAAASTRDHQVGRGGAMRIPTGERRRDSALGTASSGLVVQFENLHSQLSAMLVLAYDVSVAMQEPWWSPTFKDQGWFDFLVFSRGQGDASPPSPQWPSIRDEMLVLQYWDISTRGIRGTIATSQGSDSFDWLAWHFVDAVLAIASDRHAVPPMGSERPEEWRKAWQTLGRRVAEQGQKKPASRRDQCVQEWCVARAVLIAAPESVLSEEVAEEFLDGLGNTVDEPTVLRGRNAVLERRIQKRGLGAKPNHTVADEAAKLATDHPLHPWVKRFGERTA